MSMVLLTFVISVILSFMSHAIIHRPIWASIAAGVVLVFFVRFFFGYHFPEIDSFDFWMFSAVIATLGFFIAHFIGRISRSFNKNKA